MSTATSLQSYTHKDLAQMAKKRRIAGWHAMRKDQLVNALLRHNKSSSSKSLGIGSRTETTESKKKRAIAKRTTTAAQRRIREAKQKRTQRMDLTTASMSGDPAAKRGASGKPKAAKRDRIVLMVRDPYWLQVNWELTAKSVERAQAALAQNWHAARPVLRVIELPSSAIRGTAERIDRIIDIHGGVQSWYIDVNDPPNSYRVEIGYLTADDHFHALSRSNTVTTPQLGGPDVIDSHWSDVIENSERIFAMSSGHDGKVDNGELREWLEERLHRPLGSPMVTQFGNGAQAILPESRAFSFQIDAEMIVYGRMTEPDAFVTMGGEPVKLNADGSFTARLSLPDRRQVIPIVASSRDGVQEQTIVLAIERNTKVMEPKIREPGK